MTALDLIHELWVDHQHACPYLRHDEGSCFFTGPMMRDAVAPYMPCHTASLQLWCLTDANWSYAEL